MSGICQSQTSVRKPKLRFRNCAPGGLANPPEMPDVYDLSIPDEHSGSILLSIMEGVKKQDISDDAPNSDVAKYFGNQFG